MKGTLLVCLSDCVFVCNVYLSEQRLVFLFVTRMRRTLLVNISVRANQGAAKVAT